MYVPKMKTIPQLSPADVSRLWSHVQVDPETGCWRSINALDKHGYAVFGMKNANGKWSNYLAHRVTYAHFRKQPTAILDHIVCDTRNCMNPNHVEESTLIDNVNRSDKAPCVINRNATHCKWGHEFDGSWTGPDAKGKVRTHRVCKTCKYESVKKSRAKKRMTK